MVNLCSIFESIIRKNIFKLGNLGSKQDEKAKSKILNALRYQNGKLKLINAKFKWIRLGTKSCSSQEFEYPDFLNTKSASLEDGY